MQSASTKSGTPAENPSPIMPIEFATSETCIISRSIAVEPPSSGYNGSRRSFRAMGKANRLAAVTRAFRAIKRLTVARGQPRARDVYCGKMAFIRDAKPLMRRIKMTVNAGFGEEKRVSRDV